MIGELGKLVLEGENNSERQGRKHWDGDRALLEKETEQGWNESTI